MESESWKLSMLKVVLSIIRHVREVRNALHLEVSSIWTMPRIRPLVSDPNTRNDRLKRQMEDRKRSFDDVHL